MRLLQYILISLSFFFLLLFFLPNEILAEKSEPITLKVSTKKQDVYPAIDIFKADDNKLTVDEIVSKHFAKQFKPIKEIKQRHGFFYRANWLRFDIENQSLQNDWFLEFAFPLIHQLEIYAVENDRVVPVYKSGADLPFNHRKIDHRNFVLELDIDQGETKTFYALATGSGDLHPPITMWDKEHFVEKTQREFALLGIFYGVIIVMIAYNLFLFFSLRLKSYLYYVIVITFALLGKLSINGIGFQYLWPNFPAWNAISTLIWVALACIFILIFTRDFLDIDRYIPTFKKFFYTLILMNSLIIIVTFFSRYIALHLMVAVSLITFLTSLLVAIICLIRGAREARFYIAGWVIFLTGVSITILERAVFLPFNAFTEYAGQAAITIEVVLLSLALADKIKLMRREKERAEKKARESEQLAMKNLRKADQLKDEFLAITSHELRTPLYGMIGIAESLHDGISGDVSKDMQNQLSMIISSGKRLTRLVNEILDFSKLKTDSLDLQTKPVHLSGIIEIVQAMTKPLLDNKPIQLINKIHDELPPVKADENRLQQIFYNLFDNAIKYTDEGSITIYTSTTVDSITIHVEDTGRGISEKNLQTIFQPFIQGDDSLSRDVSGVGIGLAITKSLVDLHDGNIKVNSALEKGSTFSVTLPIYEETTLTSFTPVVESNILDEETDLLEVHFRSGKNHPLILVVDDEIVNLQVLMNQLTLEGYDVLTSQRGEDVFTILEKHPIDLIILDIMMPGISGYEVSQKLRETYTIMDLPILMLTAKNQLQDKMLAFEAGANDYLVKPCDKQELLSRVKTLVQMKILNEEIIQMNLDLEGKVMERTEELKHAYDQLKEILDSRRQLLANIAHELGTPVTIIHNYIQSLQQGLVMADDRHYGKLVSDKINVLNRLIEDLYDLSLLEADKVKFNLRESDVAIWINQVIQKCTLTVEQAERKYIKNDVTIPYGEYFCSIDTERMDQLFSNLISNAIKNTHKFEGEISIHASIVDDKQLVMTVSDNGFGIKEENLPYIFDRFYKYNAAENYHMGTGLGLTIVKQIIQHHQGDIWVESKVMHGTTFHIIIPINLLQEEPSEELVDEL